MTSPKIVLITGPAGSGKTTLARELCASPGHRRWPSWTTRAPRSGEVAGFDYEFVARARFEQAIADGELLEHIVGPGGARYGLPAPPGDADACLVAVVSRDACDRAHMLFGGFEIKVIALDAPDEVLLARMRHRGDDDDAVDARARLFAAERPDHHDE